GHVGPGKADVRRKDGLAGRDGVAVPRNLVDRLRSRGVRFHADRAVVGERGLIEEGRNRRRIVEEPEAAAHDEVVAPVRLIRESEARAEVLPRSRIEILDVPADDDQSSTVRIERREILSAVVHRSLEVPPQTEVDVQLTVQPPRILREQVGQVLVDVTSDVAAEDRRLIYVSGQEVSERGDVRVVAGHAQHAAPWSLSAVAKEISAAAVVVAAAGAELLDADTPDFPSEAHLVLPLRIREGLGHVRDDIGAARVRTDTGGIESGDREKRRAGQIAPAHAGVEAEAH